MFAYVGRGIEYTGKAVKAVAVAGLYASVLVGIAGVLVAPLFAASSSNSRHHGRDTHRRGATDDGFFRGFSFGVIWSDLWTTRAYARAHEPSPASRAASSSWGVAELMLFSGLIVGIAVLVALIFELPLLALSCTALWSGFILMFAVGHATEMLGGFMYDAFKNVSLNPLAYVYECCVDFKNWCFPKNGSENRPDSKPTVVTVPDALEVQFPVDGIPLGMGYGGTATFFQPRNDSQYLQGPAFPAPGA